MGGGGKEVISPDNIGPVPGDAAGGFTRARGGSGSRIEGRPTRGRLLLDTMGGRCGTSQGREDGAKRSGVSGEGMGKRSKAVVLEF